MIELKRYRAEILFPVGYNAQNCNTDLPTYLPIFKNHNQAIAPIGRVLNHWSVGKEWHCDCEIWEPEINNNIGLFELSCGVISNKPMSSILELSISLKVN